MKKGQEQSTFKEVGRGFIISNQGSLTGRKLTKAYMDQNKRTYVIVNGEFELLTKRHNYLPAD